MEGQLRTILELEIVYYKFVKHNLVKTNQNTAVLILEATQFGEYKTITCKRKN